MSAASAACSLARVMASASQAGFMGAGEGEEVGEFRNGEEGEGGRSPKAPRYATVAADECLSAEC